MAFEWWITDCQTSTALSSEINNNNPQHKYPELFLFFSPFHLQHYSCSSPVNSSSLCINKIEYRLIHLISHCHNTLRPMHKRGLNSANTFVDESLSRPTISFSIAAEIDLTYEEASIAPANNYSISNHSSLEFLSNITGRIEVAAVMSSSIRSIFVWAVVLVECPLCRSLSIMVWIRKGLNSSFQRDESASGRPSTLRIPGS